MKIAPLVLRMQYDRCCQNDALCPEEIECLFPELNDSGSAGEENNVPPGKACHGQIHEKPRHSTPIVALPAESLGLAVPDKSVGFLPLLRTE